MTGTATWRLRVNPTVSVMTFPIETVSPEARRPKPTDESSLGFGKIYSDHMFTMKWSPDTGWVDAKVVPFGELTLSPAALVLHYGQTIFEGLKAYRNEKGMVNLFRARDNAERFARSARRLDLPPVDVDTFVQACSALVELDHEWIPRSHGTSLYIRPTMICILRLSGAAASLPSPCFCFSLSLSAFFSLSSISLYRPTFSVPYWPLGREPGLTGSRASPPRAMSSAATVMTKAAAPNPPMAPATP